MASRESRSARDTDAIIRASDVYPDDKSIQIVSPVGDRQHAKASQAEHVAVVDGAASTWTFSSPCLLDRFVCPDGPAKSVYVESDEEESGPEPNLKEEFPN